VPATGDSCASHSASRSRGAAARAYCFNLGEAGPLSQGVQVGRKALRICHINGMDVRKKRPRGFKKRPRGFK
jgi:hypothetical protein